MIWRGRSIGEQNGGIKRLVIYCWVRGLSSKYICIYGVLSDSVSPQFQLEWDHWVLGTPAPWGANSWSLCPVWRCQCAPPAGLVFACRAAQQLGARYWGSHKAGRDREQKVCQLAGRDSQVQASFCRHDKVSHVCVWCLCTRHVTLRQWTFVHVSCSGAQHEEPFVLSVSSGSTHSTLVLARTRDVEPHLY